MKRILIIEPVCFDKTHFSFNLGLLRMVAATYPHAQLTLVGNDLQNRRLLEKLDQSIASRCQFRDWLVYPDRDTTPLNVLARLLRLLKASGLAVFNADLIIMSAIEPTCLTTLQMLLRKSQTLQIFFHGNLNNLSGWRSRNPLRSTFDFAASIARAVKGGAQLIVLEKHIRSKAQENYPWLSKNIFYLPIPQLIEEISHRSRALEYPIKIGIAGVASRAKGYAHFLQFAQILKNQFPGRYELHAIGTGHNECSSLNDEWLDTKPFSTQLERPDFLDRLDAMDFLFLWPDSSYYAYAASGVFYDAINRGIPLICRLEPDLLPEGFEKLGIADKSLEGAASTLANITPEQYVRLCEAVRTYSEGLSGTSLINIYRKIGTARDSDSGSNRSAPQPETTE